MSDISRSVKYMHIVTITLAIISLVLTSIPYIYDELYTEKTIYGYINDSDGNPVSNATVEIEGLSVHTRLDGKFIFNDISYGEKTIIVETSSISYKNKLLLNRADKIIEYNITLKNYTQELSAQILSPKNNNIVSVIFPIRGTVSRPLKEGEHLWIAVNPSKCPGYWWPQTRELNIPYQGERLTWEGVVYLGGKENDEFTISVLLVDEVFNNDIEKWIKHSEEVAEWLPLRIDQSSQILESITVYLGNPRKYN
jgi:hypothetical protein